MQISSIIPVGFCDPVSRCVCMNIYFFNKCFIRVKASCWTCTDADRHCKVFPQCSVVVLSFWYSSLREKAWGSMTPNWANQRDILFTCQLVSAHTDYIQGFHKLFSQDPEYKWNIIVNPNMLIVSVCQCFLLGVKGYWSSMPVSRC